MGQGLNYSQIFLIINDLCVQPETFCNGVIQEACSQRALWLVLLDKAGHADEENILTFIHELFTRRFLRENHIFRSLARAKEPAIPEDGSRIR